MLYLHVVFPQINCALTLVFSSNISISQKKIKTANTQNIQDASCYAHMLSLR